MKSKIEVYYTTGQDELFYKELTQFLSFLIRRYVGNLEASQFEELRDALVFRVINTLNERPFITGRSDFRSYIFSVARNGISSFKHRRSREILSDDVREPHPETPRQPFMVNAPGFDEDFNILYPHIYQRTRECFDHLVQDGIFNEQLFALLPLEEQNFIRVLLWRVFVKEK